MPRKINLERLSKSQRQRKGRAKESREQKKRNLKTDG